MSRRISGGLLGLLGLVVAGIGCSRANVYAITGEPSADASTRSDQSAAPPVVCPSPVLPFGDSTRTLSVDSVSRSFVLHVPRAYDGSKPVPLILDFHSIGSTAAGEADSSLYPAVTDPEGVIVAYPEGMKMALGGAWNLGPCCIAGVDDLGFARALLAHLAQIACIDANRVYTVGTGTGGGMAYHLACNAAEVIAAVAPAGFDLMQENVDACKPLRPLTVLSFRGTADSHVPYNGGAGTLVPDMTITFLGAKATYARWAQIDGCTGSSSGDDSRGCSTYGGCPAGVEVTLCTKSGGKEEPGDATIAWPVLKRSALPTR
jgi:polyhydroxybutyrate depolymerase